MAVVINAETGQAEDLPEKDSLAALQAGTHHVALNDTEGNPVIAPYGEAQTLLSQGYSQPSGEQLQGLLHTAKYGSGLEQAKAFAEGAASAATFGASTAVERALGVDPGAIQARREENPVAYGAGEMAGLTASSLVGLGEGAALARAGEAVGARIAGEGLAARVGSGAARAMAENALFQTGDEASKLFAGDPDQSVGSAAAAVGLSGLIGAGFGAGIGAVSPIWKAVQESKLAEALSSFRARANGTPADEMVAASMAERAGAQTGAEAGPLSFGGLPDDQIAAAEAALGVQVPASVRAGMSADPLARAQYQVLQESNTTTAHAVQKELNAFHKQQDDLLLGALGKTEADVAAAGRLSAHDEGQKVVGAIADSIGERLKPVSKVYDKIENTFASVPLENAEKAVIGNRLGELMASGKFDLVPGSEEASLINRLYEGLGKSTTVDDLRKVSEIIGKEAERKQLYHLGRQIREVVEESAESALEAHLGASGSSLLGEWLAIKPVYGALKRDINGLAEELSVGSFRGPKGFLKNLKEMHPERVLSQLNPKNKAAVGELLETTFPEVGATLKSYLRDSALREAASKAKGDALLNPKTFFQALDKWSPEYRKFVLGEAEEKIAHLKVLQEALPASMNPSGTAKTVKALMGDSLSGGIGAMVAALTGHGAIATGMAAVAASAGKMAANESKDAVRLGFLKLLASPQSVSSPGFKAMVDMADAVIKGESLMNRATKAIFSSGRDVLPQSMIPKPEKREKLDKRLQSLRNDFSPLLNAGGETGYYLPDHAAAIGMTGATAVQYLQSLKPDTTKRAPLDPPMPVSKAAQARYDRALDIAEQPLIVMESLKRGTITPEDVQTLNTLYPALHERLASKIMNQITDVMSKGDTIPYSTRLSLSLFMGMGLDSTMMPEAILAFQPKSHTGMAAVMGGKQKGSMKSLEQVASMDQTTQQARVQAKNEGLS